MSKDGFSKFTQGIKNPLGIFSKRNYLKNLECSCEACLIFHKKSWSRKHGGISYSIHHILLCTCKKCEKIREECRVNLQCIECNKKFFKYKYLDNFKKYQDYTAISFKGFRTDEEIQELKYIEARYEFKSPICEKCYSEFHSCNFCGEYTHDKENHRECPDCGECVDSTHNLGCPKLPEEIH